MRLDDRASQHWPALQGSRFDSISLLDLATYTAGGLRCSSPTRCRRTRHRSATTTASGSRPTRRAASASIPTRASACSAISPRAAWASRSNGLWSSKCSRHWASNRPTSTCPRRRWRSTPRATARTTPLRVGPGPLDAEGYGVKTSAADPALRRCQPASGRLDRPWAQALDATHRGYYKVGDMTQGTGLGSLRLADLPEAPAGRRSTPMALQPHRIAQAARATGAGEPAPAEQDRLHQRLRRLRGVRPGPRPGLVILANRNYPNAERVKIAYAILGTGAAGQGAAEALKRAREGDGA